VVNMVAVPTKPPDEFSAVQTKVKLPQHGYVTPIELPDAERFVKVPWHNAELIVHVKLAAPAEVAVITAVALFWALKH
jgi:hypothetical protein